MELDATTGYLMMDLSANPRPVTNESGEVQWVTRSAQYISSVIDNNVAIVGFWTPTNTTIQLQIGAEDNIHLTHEVSASAEHITSLFNKTTLLCPGKIPGVPIQLFHPTDLKLVCLPLSPDNMDYSSYYTTETSMETAP